VKTATTLPTFTRTLEGWRESLRSPAAKSFFKAMLLLSLGMGFALYSAAAAARGGIIEAGVTTAMALGLAGYVAVTIVPVLARRTPLRWLGYRITYRLTKEGKIYLLGVGLIILAALNTGNNLLFLILAAMLAGILVSGVASWVVLTGIELKLDLPEHIFAEQPALAAVELENEKLTLPSFSLRITGDEEKAGAQILSRPVFFPYVPRQQAGRQQVELQFPRRGVYRQDAFNISTRFPFGFLEKARKVESSLAVVVYPRVTPTEDFYEVLPLISGEVESFYRGRGHDLYSIRDHLPGDSARHVDWKASAKASELKVREFTREDERRVLLVLDPCVEPDWLGEQPGSPEERFERAVKLCACLAWHFHEVDSEVQYRTPRYTTAMAPAGEIIYDILRDLAFVEMQPGDGSSFLRCLAAEPDLFKIILTSQPRGSIPTDLWTSSYFVFMQSL
jgi:uncharacterized protein (DUF58 family)